MTNLPEVANEHCATSPTKGRVHEVGDQFSAASFRQDHFSGLMNPLLMVDHFRMRAPTFGMHRHQGFSAVTYVFEDSRSAHLNHDSIGNDRPIEPGSLHWLAAGRGVMHDEWPGGEDPETHGLQFFVNLPLALREEAPYAIHIDANDIPVVEEDGKRVRVVSGNYGGRRSPLATPQSFSLYDVFAQSGKTLEFDSLAGPSAWLYVLEGLIELGGTGKKLQVGAEFAVAVRLGTQAGLRVSTSSEAHFVVMSGEHV